MAKASGERSVALPVIVLIMVAIVIALVAPGGGVMNGPANENPVSAQAVAVVTPSPPPSPTPTPTVAPTPTPTRTEAIDEDDGVIIEGEEISVFDDDHPALAGINPDLLLAAQSAALDAEAEGIVMVVTSGWRSPEYQQALLDEAIVTYGSEAEALRWVMTPERSSHVTGNAIDIGYTDASYWMIEHGYEYGLCQTYANEIWHFELTVAPGEPCPAPIDDANAG